MISTILFTSCTSPSNDLSKNEDHQEWSLIAKHHSVSQFQFGEIIKELSRSRSEEDLIYIRGMADLYLLNNPIFMPAVIVNSKETSNMIDPSLQDGLLRLYKNEFAYLKEIKEILDKNDLQTIQNRKDEFVAIYKLERELNDNRLIHKKDLQNYKKTLDEMNRMLEKGKK